MNYQRFFEDAISKLKTERRYRVFADLDRDASSFPRALWRRGGDGGEGVVIWCSNDYLCMGRHPAVIEAMSRAAARHGVGAGGTRNISGTTHYHVELEHELADLHGKEAALVFTSAYIANDATLSSPVVPRTKRPVASASARAPLAATTVALTHREAGAPVRGSSK